MRGATWRKHSELCIYRSSRQNLVQTESGERERTLSHCDSSLVSIDGLIIFI